MFKNKDTQSQFLVFLVFLFIYPHVFCDCNAEEYYQLARGPLQIEMNTCIC